MLLQAAAKTHYNPRGQTKVMVMMIRICSQVLRQLVLQAGQLAQAQQMAAVVQIRRRQERQERCRTSSL
jgi:hypothetical protein